MQLGVFVVIVNNYCTLTKLEDLTSVLLFGATVQGDLLRDKYVLLWILLHMILQTYSTSREVL